MKKSKFAYPAIFTPHEMGEGYSVYFPDLENNTDGENIEDALEMSKDGLCGALCVLEDEGVPFPAPSKPETVQASNGGFVSMVMVDVQEYRRGYDQTLVKKTLNIPRWLNEKGDAAGVNFSKLLTEALERRLGL